LLRVLGFPLDPPQAVINRILSDLSAVARAAREAPAQLDLMLALGEEIAEIGRAVLAIAERLDERATEILILGARLDQRTSDLIDLGVRIHALGERVDSRGAEVAAQAGAVVETANELITVLPTLERALQLATPLEGAIDRFGRLVDRLPGGRRVDSGAGAASGPFATPPRPDAGAATPSTQRDARPATPASYPPSVRWPRPAPPLDTPEG
jgi:hypothetical protein